MAKKLKLNQKIETFLKSSRRKQFTYGDLAKHFRTAPMAVGQAMSAIAARGQKRLTKRVKAAA